MKTVALEDLITIVCSDFVKQNKEHLLKYDRNGIEYIPYLKMNYSQRYKISEKLLMKMEQDFKGEKNKYVKN